MVQRSVILNKSPEQRVNLNQDQSRILSLSSFVGNSRQYAQMSNDEEEEKTENLGGNGEGIGHDQNESMI
jgi:hypothetical protein